MSNAELFAKHEIQHHTVCDGWVNTWSEGDQPVTFETEDEALAELADFLKDVADEGMDYSAEDFRIAVIA